MSKIQKIVDEITDLTPREVLQLKIKLEELWRREPPDQLGVREPKVPPVSPSGKTVSDPGYELPDGQSRKW